MSLTELSSPIRMYWDLDDAGDGVDYARIADEIIENKLLTLQITAKELNGSCRIVLERLKDKRLVLSLALPFSAWNQETLGLIRSFPIKLFLISTSSLGDLESILSIQNQVAGKPAFGIAFHVTRDNFRALPEVLEFCIDNQIENLVLPMQRLIGGEEVFSFSSQERKQLTSNLTRIERPAWLKITIHDPFLWRTFFPSIEFPDGGCQAANTMLYISPQADVYPCPTLPVKIGNLKQMSLKHVIASDLKKQVRKSILATPADCRNCEEVKQCKGGCQGRAFVVHGGSQKSDPACT